jgi:hypothetical protein
MSAAELTEKVSTLIQDASFYIAKIKQVTQYDWAILPHKGVWKIEGSLNTGADATLTRPTLTVNNKGTAYTATSTSIAYDGGTVTRSATSFYIETASGEIIEVIDSAPAGADGTLTVKKRGCFGTTASATGIADENTLYVTNVVVLGDNQTGAVTILFRPMPEDPNTPLFA